MAPERITSLPVLKPRVEDGHKGLYGTVLVIAGGRGWPEPPRSAEPRP